MYPKRAGQWKTGGYGFYHVKANASRTSEHLVDAMEKPGVYWERLDQFKEEGLEELEKKVSQGKPEGNGVRKGQSR